METFFCSCFHTKIESSNKNQLKSFDGTLFTLNSENPFQTAYDEICNMKMGSDECTKCTLEFPTGVQAKSNFECTNEHDSSYDYRKIEVSSNVAISAEMETYFCSCFHTKIEASTRNMLTSFDGTTFSLTESNPFKDAYEDICNMRMGSSECSDCTLTLPTYTPPPPFVCTFEHDSSYDFRTIEVDSTVKIYRDMEIYFCSCFHTKIKSSTKNQLTSFDGTTFTLTSENAFKDAYDEICKMSMGSEECTRCTLKFPTGEKSSAMQLTLLFAFCLFVLML